MRLLLFFLTLSLSILALSSCGQSSEGSLDGQTFEIEVWDVNNPDQRDPDQFIFQDSKVRSPACEEWGFGEGTYNATQENGTIAFGFVMTSEEEGVMEFSGTVQDGQIQGSFVWEKEGQNDIRYQFEGSRSE